MTGIWEQVKLHTTHNFRVSFNRTNRVATLFALIVIPAVIPGLIALFSNLGIIEVENQIITPQNYSAFRLDETAFKDEWIENPQSLGFGPADSVLAQAVCTELGVAFEDTRRFATKKELLEGGFTSESSDVPIQVGAFFNESGEISVVILTAKGRLLETEGTPIGDEVGDNEKTPEDGAQALGVAYFQSVVDRVILEYVRDLQGDTTPFTEDVIEFQRMEESPQVIENFIRPWFFAIGFVGTILNGQVFGSMGRQEEKKERRQLMLHGERGISYILSWFLTSAIRCSIAGIVAVVVIYSTGLLKTTFVGAHYVLLSFIGFALCQASLTVFVAASIGKRATATMMTGIASALFLIYALVFALFTAFVLDDYYSDTTLIAENQWTIIATFVPLFVQPFAHIMFCAGLAMNKGVEIDTVTPILGWAIGSFFVTCLLLLGLALLADWYRFSAQGGATPGAPDGDVAIQAEGLVKKFRVADEKKKNKMKTLYAVDGVDVSISSHQVFCLLGQNGAGKSTMIDLMNGTRRPSRGTVFVNGLPVSRQPSLRRGVVGLCAQHDETLGGVTCLQQLVMFGRMIGLAKDSAHEEAMKLLTALDIAGKKDEAPNNLSGGQLRRLSLASAIIGNPKVIFLDEPTTGMDVHVRKKIWAVIKALTKTSTVVLTTHSMEEASELADEIAIMIKGKIVIQGSLPELRKGYGNWFHLSLTLKTRSPGADEYDAMLDQVQKYVPKAEFVRSYGPKLSINLPADSLARFPTLFKELETSEKIRSFGVSPSTLDDVFLRVIEENKGEDDGTAQDDAQDDAGVSKTEATAVPIQEETNDGNEATYYGSLKLLPSTSRQVRVIARQILRNFMRMPSTLFELIGLPIAYSVITGLLFFFLTKNGGISFDDPFSSVSLNKAAEGLSPPVQAVVADNFTEWQQAMGDYATPFEYPIEIISGLAALQGVEVRVNSSKFTSLMARIIYSPGQPFFTPPYGRATLHAIYSQMAKQISGNTFDMTYEEWPGLLRTNSPEATNMLHLPAMSAAIVIGCIAITIARVRLSRFQEILLLTGVSPIVFWGTYFVVFSVILLMVFLLCIAILAACNTPAVVNGSILGYILFFLVLTPATVNTAFVASLVIKNVEAWESTQWTLGIIPFLIVWPVSAYAFTGKDPSLEYDNAANILVPSFGFYRVLVAFQAAALNNRPLDTVSKVFEWDNIVLQAICMTAISAVLYGFLLLWLTGSLQFARVKNHRVDVDAADDFGAAANNDIENEGILEANKRNVQAGILPDPFPVYSTEQDEKPMLKTENLSKRFGDFNAVRNVNLEIAKGEIFALLGPNGSGKSTLSNCISHLKGYGPTSGTASVNGYSVSKELPNVRKELGVCPQFDCLLESLTPRELFIDMCEIRGVDPESVPSVVQYYLDSLELTPVADNRCKTLSGGNKRRTSIGMSLTGNPSVIILDEPTTGVDIQSRNSVWDFLLSHANSTQASTIITTHALDEAEILSERMAIMVGGSIRVAGSANQLKSLYGGGFVVELAPKDPNTDLSQMVQRFNRNATFISQGRVSSKFFIPLETGLRWSSVFEFFTKQETLDYFTVDQRSLDDVFIQLATLVSPGTPRV